jgi:hypothetical protein
MIFNIDDGMEDEIKTLKIVQWGAGADLKYLFMIFNIDDDMEDEIKTLKIVKWGAGADLNIYL